MTRNELARVVGGNIAAERISREHTQEWLANRIGCRRELLSMFENGRRLPSLDWLLRIAGVLGCPVTAFLAGVCVVEEAAA
jgi:DNA-binding XRE family transcriptional regulator